MTATLVDTLDNFGLFVSRCIGVGALTLVGYASIQLVKINTRSIEEPAPAVPEAEPTIDFKNYYQLTQRDPALPPQKEKHRMA